MTDDHQMPFRDSHVGKAGKHGGGYASLRDPRVSSVINWLWGTMGAALIMIGIWIATSINELNLTSARLIVQLEAVNRQLAAKDARDDAQDRRIDGLSGDMREMQGKVFRGVDGYETQAGARHAK